MEHPAGWGPATRNASRPEIPVVSSRRLGSGRGVRFSPISTIPPRPQRSPRPLFARLGARHARPRGPRVEHRLIDPPPRSGSPRRWTSASSTRTRSSAVCRAAIAPSSVGGLVSFFGVRRRWRPAALLLALAMLATIFLPQSHRPRTCRVEGHAHARRRRRRRRRCAARPAAARPSSACCRHGYFLYAHCFVLIVGSSAA